MSERKPQIVLGVTGSIAAYKAGDIIRRLQDQGFEITVIMTAEAEKFITPLTLSTLSRNPVYCEMFDIRENAWEAQHIPLAESADLVLIAPATANIISKIACGIADDLLSCTAMATRAPMVIAPAMNEKMYLNPIFQDNCRKLKKNGVKFIEPIKGKLACGMEGQGHLAELDVIVKEVKKSMKFPAR